MQCLFCGNIDTKVIDSRTAGDGLSIRRRRECEQCDGRFSTVEQGEILGIIIIKRDGHRETYDKEKLAQGLRRSLEKRPYTAENFIHLVQQIERDIQQLRKEELSSQEVGEIALKNLKEFDQVAYIRFASVYRSFQDIDSFLQELKCFGRRR